MVSNRSENRNGTFGEWLRSAIIARGMTQNEFAIAIGVSKSTVSRWINGDTPKGQFIEKIADVLVLSYDFVNTKVGYRPKELDDEGEDIVKREILPMIQKIDWSDKRAVAGVKHSLEFWIASQQGDQTQ